MSRDAVRGVQLLLRAKGSNIVADGLLGPRTMAALASSKSSAIRTVVEEFNIKHKEPESSSRVFVPDSLIEQSIDVAAKRFGQKVVPFLRLMVELENIPAPGGVFTTYDGTFKGIGQFGADTWRLGVAKFPEVGAYDNVRDVEKSMLLAAWYYLDHEAAFARFRRRSGAQGDFGPALGYLYHQQGSSAAESYLQTGVLRYPRQSNKSIAVMRAVRGSVMV